MIVTYLYDGTFDGLLTCVYEYYYSNKKAEEIVYEGDFFPDLIHEALKIETSEEKSKKVLNAVKSKIGIEALENIFTLFLSEEEGFELLFLNYIKLGFKFGSEIHHHMHNDVVLRVDKVIRKVNYEAHRMTGFVRFKAIGQEIYFAAIEPDHNILTLIAPHFSERFSNQCWIIQDLRRQIALMYNGTEWVITPMSTEASEKLQKAADGIYEDLWRTYYATIAIKERENPKLRKRLMPARYWKHMTEFKT